MKTTLYNENVISALQKIPNESIDCIITSPPYYYGLRTYLDTDTIWGGDSKCEHEWKDIKKEQNSNKFNEQMQNVCFKCGAWKGQLGFEPTYKMYIEHLMLVTKELKRVLKKTGTLFWNMGDSYESFEKSTLIDQNIKTKSLMMMPERFAIEMINDGWILRNKIIWYKSNGKPSSVKDRLSNKWEYVFFFTKSKKYYFDLDSIKKPFTESSIKRISQKNIPNQFKSGKSFEFSKTNPVNNIPKTINNMYQKYQNENIIFNGANPGDFELDNTIYDLFDDPNIQSAFIDFLEKENPELLMPTALDISTLSNKFAHFAVFPETLIIPLIKAGCPKVVCSKCGKPKILGYERNEFIGKEKHLTGKNILEPKVNSPGNRKHYFSNIRKYEVNQKEIALFVKEYITKDKLNILNNKFGETKWKHWIRTDDTGGALPSPSEYKDLKEILNFSDKHDKKMLTTVRVLIDDSGDKRVGTGFKPTCSCNTDFKPGVVLDPFAGSGTTGIVARELERSAILIEISKKYCDIIKERLNWGMNINVEYEVGK